MTKFPVWATVEDAWQYTLCNLREIIGTNGAVLFGYYGFFIAGTVILAILAIFIKALKGNLLSQVGLGLIVFVLGFSFLAVSLYGMSVVITGLIRQAMGLRKVPQNWCPFTDPAANRYLGAFLKLCALVVPISVAGGVLRFGLASVSSVLGWIGFVIPLCVCVYVSVRLGWQIGPMAVTQNHVSLRACRMQSRGNFWRIYAISLGIFLPLSVVAFFVQYLMPVIIFWVWTGLGVLPQAPDHIGAAGVVMGVFLFECLLQMVVSLGVYVLMLVLCARAQARCYQFAGAESSNAAE